ncbi:MAG: GNAT family N-acetyltransferase [Ruminococcus sp.]|uniref:GNAT family N-acetyltransferase n=1 Tax=Ruminococcus sp. TaxID=41978 RepID=UPI0025FAEA01|nr:GNAT family N-acetyltransferase [Ruminococcus sp.]MCR4794459.1 GNAT family N-acetyltransferase [Ruminococcus sp.]
MILRRFEADDSSIILSWIKNEREFRLWSADRFGDYPSAPEMITAHHNMCSRTGDFFPLTAVDENGNIEGHLILRFIDDERKEIRFGFVIVDSSHRGMGLGRKMLELAKRYAADVLHAERLSLGVFENNQAAVKCYRAVGFVERTGVKELFQTLGESWKCIEMAMNI